jgi:hypothetical protein
VRRLKKALLEGLIFEKSVFLWSIDLNSLYVLFFIAENVNRTNLFFLCKNILKVNFLDCKKIFVKVPIQSFSGVLMYEDKKKKKSRRER